MEPDKDQVALAEELCKHFTEYEPYVDRCKSRCVIRHKSNDGRSLVIFTKTSKYEVSGVWPRYQGLIFKAFDESIKVSVNRGVEALVKGIKQRLLERYETAYAVKLKEMQEDISIENAEFALRDEILGMVDNAVSEAMSHAKQVNCYQYGLNKVCVSGPNVKLETAYLPRDVAIEIVELLKKRMPKK